MTHLFKIKAIKWEKHHDGCFYAESPFGKYWIYYKGKDWKRSLPWKLWIGGSYKFYKSLTLSKKAAALDYENKIKKWLIKEKN